MIPFAYEQPIIHMMPQGSEEWFAAKCGKISASRMSDVLAKGQGKTRKAYMMKLIAERLSGIKQPTYCNGSMQWGIDTEPLARQAYEEANYVTVEQVGFIEVSPYEGVSPDGFIGTDGILEIKCPDTATHLQYILDNRFPSEYHTQVQDQLRKTKRLWCDFVSYDPRVLVRPYWSIRVGRDEAKIEEITLEVKRFIADLLELEARIKGE